MAAFYVLPPRALLDQRLLAALGIHDLKLPPCVELAESFGKAVEATGAYVAFRDDLPFANDLAQSLMDGFGAETGDEVIEISLDTAPRRWRLAGLPLAA